MRQSFFSAPTPLDNPAELSALKLIGECASRHFRNALLETPFAAKDRRWKQQMGSWEKHFVRPTLWVRHDSAKDLRGILNSMVQHWQSDWKVS